MVIFFKKILFFTLYSSTSLALKVSQITARLYAWKHCAVFFHYKNVFGVFVHFQRNKKQKENSPDKRSERILRLFCLQVLFLFTSSEKKLENYHKKLNVRIYSQVNKKVKIYNLREWRKFTMISNLNTDFAKNRTNQRLNFPQKSWFTHFPK